MSNTKTKTKSTSITGTIHQTIDDGMSSVERIHKSIAALPLDVLSSISPLEEAMTEIRDLQDRTLTSIYGLLRKVNAQADQTTREILAS